jgi:hypothetical protein
MRYLSVLNERTDSAYFSAANYSDEVSISELTRQYGTYRCDRWWDSA